MFVYHCPSHLHSHPSSMDSFSDLSWSAETFVAIVLAKVSPKPSLVVPFHGSTGRPLAVLAPAWGGMEG